MRFHISRVAEKGKKRGQLFPIQDKQILGNVELFDIFEPT